MSEKPFDHRTTIAEILRENPALIEVFDEWKLHLVPSTVVALTVPIGKAANYHAIFNVEALLADLNARRKMKPGEYPHREDNGRINW